MVTGAGLARNLQFQSLSILMDYASNERFMTKRFSSIQWLLVMALVSVGAARGEDSSVARALGLKSREAAAALESGATRAWNQGDRELDPTRQKMNAETSVFLRNSPGASREIAAALKPYEASLAPRAGRIPPKNAADVERDLALQQLEFRQNVEGAMKRILSFSPTVRSGAQGNSEPSLQPEMVPAGAHDRLIQSAVGAPSPFRTIDVPREAREIQPEPNPVVLPDVDERVPSRGAQFEPTAEDDEGKPVRVGVSGDFGGADFPVISMRRGSRKANPAAIPILPALRDVNGSEAQLQLQALPKGAGLPSLPDTTGHFR